MLLSLFTVFMIICFVVNASDFTIRVRINGDVNQSMINIGKGNNIVIETADICHNDPLLSINIVENKTHFMYPIIFNDIKPMLDWNESGGPQLLLNGIFMDESDDIQAVILENSNRIFNINELNVLNNTYSDKTTLVAENEKFLISSIHYFDLLSSSVFSSTFNYNVFSFMRDIDNNDNNDNIDNKINIEWNGEWVSSNFHVLATNAANTASDVMKIYKEWASTYNDEMAEYNYSSYKSVINELSLTVNTIQKAKILDVGCGTGLLGNYLRRFYNDSHFILNGIDISPEMLQFAIETDNYDEIKQCDVTTFIPYFSNSYDIILSAGLFYEGSAAITAINEMLRVLKKNGILIVTMRCTYYEKYQQTLTKILLYNQHTIIKKIKKPYYGLVEAFVIIIQYNNN